MGALSKPPGSTFQPPGGCAGGKTGKGQLESGRAEAAGAEGLGVYTQPARRQRGCRKGPGAPGDPFYLDGGTQLRAGSGSRFRPPPCAKRPNPHLPPDPACASGRRRLLRGRAPVARESLSAPHARFQAGKSAAGGRAGAGARGGARAPGPGWGPPGLTARGRAHP